ncbi:MAG: GntR family transcriptional regulator [Mogibacterium sp.]|nr:GntR family transcriptional regulator [Mogibacterium sp.]MBQ6501472.1 GntR family transcriptional regulator [Mogibacterium sp.]
MSSKKDVAYHYLKEAILADELKPGTPISEIAVAKDLGISRTPLREAMRELEREGLIISYPDRGSFVSQVSPSDVDEIYELRSMIECWCLRKGFSRLDRTELQYIKKDFEEAYEKNDWQLFHTADRKLHGMIVDSASSPRIRSFAGNLNSQCERVRRISAKGVSRSEKSLREHSAIIDAIIDGDEAKAEEALRQHLSSVGDTAIEVSRRSF